MIVLVKCQNDQWAPAASTATKPKSLVRPLSKYTRPYRHDVEEGGQKRNCHVFYM